MDRYVVESEEYRGHTIEILPDSDVPNPRTECELFCELHVKNCRYYLGEHQHDSNEEIQDVVREAEKQGDMVLRLYAYIHSGTYLSLESFYGKVPQGHAEFDSGCCGVCIIRKATVLKEYGGKKWTKKLREKAYKMAESEVDTFTKWGNGEVYCFQVDGGDGDCCCGFYDTEEALAEARSSIDYMVKQTVKAHIEQVKTWIRNRVPLYVRTSLQEALAVD